MRPRSLQRLVAGGVEQTPAPSLGGGRLSFQRRTVSREKLRTRTEDQSLQEFGTSTKHG